jgi:hypothetical protein
MMRLDKVAVIAILWVGLGVLNFGTLNAQLAWDETHGYRAHDGRQRDNVGFIALECCLIPPIELISSAFISNFWQHGWTLSARVWTREYWSICEQTTSTSFSSQALRRFEVQLSTLLGFINLALTAYLITQVRRGSKSIMADLTGLQQAVANETTIEQSAIVLLNGLSEQLKNAGTDPVALQGAAGSDHCQLGSIGRSDHRQHAGSSGDNLARTRVPAPLARRRDGTCGFHVKLRDAALSRST